MVHDNINLVDDEYIRIPIFKPSRKIKFKRGSFENIFKRWNDFRLNRLINKLEEKKDKLVGMEFSSKQLTEGHSFTEKRVLRKTKAIARLESKINFLETGKYLSEEFVNSRAIKLKSIMMNNLVYNKDCAYSVTEEAAEEIYKDRSEVDEVIDEQSAAISEKIRKIMEEKQAAKSTTESKQTVTTPPTIDDSSENTVIEKEDIESSINKKTDDIDVIPTVTSEEVADAIENEMSKIRVNNDDNSVAKVNKFINEDGTYHLTKEDIDEEIRINRFDRSKLPTEVVDMPTEPPITPFNEATKRKSPDVESPKKAITELNVGRKPIKFEKPPIPTIKNSEENKEITPETRVIPIVVPGRTEVNEFSKADGSHDVDAVMERVKMLLAESRTIDTQKEKEAIRKERVDETYNETYSKFVAYADSLEEACNASYQSLNKDKQDSEEKEAQIDAMLAMMEAGAGNLFPEGAKRRGK